MADIFREVEEELRQEQYRRIWQRYGRFIVAVVILAVLGTAAYVVWKDWRADRREALGDRFTAAEQITVPAQSAEAFLALTEEAGGGHAMLARFRAADLRAETGDREAAAALYEAIAADGSVDRLYRDAAVLHAVLYRLGSTPAAELNSRLELLTDAQSPWRYGALELQAAVAAQEGDTARARDLYTQLVDDPAAPSAVRGRAAGMLRALGG